MKYLPRTKNHSHKRPAHKHKFMVRGLFILIIFSLFLFPFIVRAESYTEKLYRVIDNIAAFLYVLGGGIAVVVIIFGGITYMTAGGSEDKVGKSKKIITSGLIGAAVVFCAGFILDLLVEFLQPLIKP